MEEYRNIEEEPIYYRIDELPFDNSPVEDIDASILGLTFTSEPQDLPEELTGHPDPILEAPRAAAIPKIALFPGQLKMGMSTKAVFPVKRAIREAGHGGGIRLGRTKYYFGPILRRRVKDFQKKRGIPQTGVYGINTHRALARFFDDYGRWLLYHEHPTTQVQQRLVNAALFGVQKEPQIHYTMKPIRMYGVRNKIRPPRIPIYEDCSSFATWCFWLAGGPDPNGRGFDGYGYTGTQINRGKRVSRPRAGDLVFYGKGWNGVPGHVAIAISPTRVVSHGNESGPQIRDYRYRDDIVAIRRYI